MVVKESRLFLTGRQQRDEGKQRKRIQFLELGIALVFGDVSFNEQKNERTRAKRNDHKLNPTREHKVKKGWMKRDGVGWGVVEAGRKKGIVKRGDWSLIRAKEAQR